MALKILNLIEFLSLQIGISDPVSTVMASLVSILHVVSILNCISGFQWHVYHERILQQALHGLVLNDSLSTTIAILYKHVFRLTAFCRENANDVHNPINSPCGKIAVYETQEAQEWLIQSHVKYDVNITFSTFRLPTNFIGCHLTALTTQWQGGKMGPFCGLRKPWSIFVPRNKATVIYLAHYTNLTTEFAAYYHVYQKGSIRGLLENYVNVESTKFTWRKSFIYMADLSYQRHIDAFHSILLIREMPSLEIQMKISTYFQLRSNVTCFDGPTANNNPLMKNLGISTEYFTYFYPSAAFVIMCRVIHHGIWEQMTGQVAMSYIARTMSSHTIVQLQQSEHVRLNLSNCVVNGVKICRIVIGNATNQYGTTRNLNSLTFLPEKFQLEVSIKELMLPRIDNSQDCLHEGLVIYDVDRHEIWSLRRSSTEGYDLVYPIIRQCRKSPLLYKNLSIQQYVAQTVVTPTSRVMIILYDLHSHTQPSGYVAISVKKANCPVLHITCKYSSPYTMVERNFIPSPKDTN